jgi:hypothetical protein
MTFRSFSIAEPMVKIQKVVKRYILKWFQNGINFSITTFGFNLFYVTNITAFKGK